MATMTEEKKQSEKWVRIADAAKHFGVSRRRIYNASSQQGARMKKDALDRRVGLISLDDLQRIFERK